MKKIVFFLLVPVFFPLLVLGQGRIVQVSSQSSGNSIIRQWTSGRYVTYTRDASGQGTVSLHTEGVSNVKSMHLPSDYYINDMQVLGDTLYLCGYRDDGTSKWGLICFLPLQSFGNGTGTLHAGIAPAFTNMYDHVSPSGAYYRDRITTINRLALFRYGGTVHVAFIANNIATVDGVPAFDHVGLGQLTYSLNGLNVEFLYNKDGVEEFTDVAATENYVVAVSRTSDSSYQYLRVVPQSDFLTPTLLPFSYGPPAYYYAGAFCQGMNDQEVFSNVRVTPLPGDCFMTGSLYRPGREGGLAIRTFRITGNRAELTQSANVPAVSTDWTSWQMHDVRYCANSLRVIMLAKMAEAADASIQDRFFVIDPSVLSGPMQFLYANGYQFESLSARSFGGWYAAGSSLLSTMLDCWRGMDAGPNGCGVVGRMASYKASLTLYRLSRPGNMSLPIFDTDDSPVVVFEEESQIVCE